MKTIDAAICADFPAIGNSGHRRESFRVFTYQAFKQCLLDMMFRYAGSGVWINTLRFRPVAEMQDAIAIALFNPTLTAGAGGHHTQGNYKQGTKYSHGNSFAYSLFLQISLISC